jgi:hypothetical protein
VNLYVDTEFDGHAGALISLAIAGDDGSHWYGIFDAHCGNEWVAEHVAPKLYAEAPTISGDLETLRLSLQVYLKQREHCTIWADWPADFEHLMHLMCGSSYAKSFMIPCTMKLIITPDGEPKPEYPHNALSDAIALRDWHGATLKAAKESGRWG